MAYVSTLTTDVTNKKPGDPIRSADWNALAAEVANLSASKLDREDNPLKGDLTVPDNLTVDGATTLRQELTVAGPARLQAELAVDGNGAIGGALHVQGDLTAAGAVRAPAFISTSRMVHRMYPAKPLIYEDIFEAFNKGVIAKLGNPRLEAVWNTRHTAANPYRLRPMLQLGSPCDSDGNGAVVTVPEGFNTLWLRFGPAGSGTWGLKAYFLDGAGEALGHWSGGRRPYQVCPDGSLPDNTGAVMGYDHQWMAIPVGRAGKVALISTHSELFAWYSGIAFSRNPWAHAAQSARGYALGFNGSKGVTWFGWQSERFAGDQAGSITRNLSQGGQALQVPVLPNGRDKLLYLVNAPEVVYGVGSSSSTGVYQDVYSPYDNGLQLTGIRVNGQPVERFLATYDNPFARYWNSRPGCNYNAALVPAELIPANARFLQVEIDLSKQEDDIKFREVGTHDLDVPLTD